MKYKKSEQLLRREAMENKLRPWHSLKHDQKPELGWIKATRQSLGLTSKELGERMGIAQPNVMALEERERRETVSLETLAKAARAMNCQFVYAFIPNEAPIKEIAPRIVPALEALETTELTPPPIDLISQLQKSLRNPR